MAATRVRPIGHEDRLSIVDHLDELRTRLIICIVAVTVCFGFTYWQNDAILKVINKPFTDAKAPGKQSDFTKGNNGALAQSARFDGAVSDALSGLGSSIKSNADTVAALARAKGVPASTLALVRASSRSDALALAKIQQVRRAIPDATPKPVTLGVTEPFITTFTVSGYAALLLALPFILFQLYAFLLPAFSPQERKTAVPFMGMVPVLFVCGVLFGYFVALPRAVDFLLNFNADNFDILVGAQQYYKFSVVLLIVVGLLFQVPVGVLAITRLGIVTPQQLSKNRGYIILAAAVLAAVATPTPDPITMMITMAPMVILFELSLILARITQRRAGDRPSRWDWDEDDEDDDPDDPSGDGPDDDSPGGLADPKDDEPAESDDGDRPQDDGEREGDAMRRALEPMGGSVRADEPSGPRGEPDL